jgi:hypothetical protein
MQSYTTLNLEKGVDVVNPADPCTEILTVSFHVAPDLRTTPSQFPDLLRSRLFCKFTGSPPGAMNLAETTFQGIFQGPSTSDST